MSSSLRYKKVGVDYARVAAALVVLLPSSAVVARLYKDSLVEWDFYLTRIFFPHYWQKRTSSSSSSRVVYAQTETRSGRPTGEARLLDGKEGRNKNSIAVLAVLERTDDRCCNFVPFDTRVSPHTKIVIFSKSLSLFVVTKLPFRLRAASSAASSSHFSRGFSRVFIVGIVGTRAQKMSYAYLLKYIIIGDTGKQLLPHTPSQSRFGVPRNQSKLTKIIMCFSFFPFFSRDRFCRCGQILPVVTIHR